MVCRGTTLTGNAVPVLCENTLYSWNSATDGPIDLQAGLRANRADAAYTH